MTSITISSGVTSSGLDIGNGDSLAVLSGGTVIDTTMDGGSFTVQAGGEAISSQIDGGTLVDSGGLLLSTTLSGSFGSLVIQDGGIASAGLIVSGGQEILASGSSPG
jgi:autotransporter passenger strand-loop-strand repeat protein